MTETVSHLAALASALGFAVPQGAIPVVSPIDGATLGGFDLADADQVADAAGRAQAAFRAWRIVPAPRRGELVRQLGEALRRHKQDLGMLVTLDCGKPLSEGLGEVQEMIDICDFAVGLSRQLYGLTIASERPGHRMSETWHPLGPVAIITAFNFPVAVWAWNAALADHAAIALVSATGSTRMGRIVGQAAARRFARSLLELGGNNASIVAPSADMDLALNACAFGFMGTSGQRCTSLRRLFVARCVYDSFVPRILSAAKRLPVGDPRDPAHLAGPLIDDAAFDAMQAALGDARALGAVVHGGERIAGPGQGVYVRPAVVEMPHQSGPMLRETFAPILYCMAYDDLDTAIALNNAAAQGLSSSIFTTDLREAEMFVAAAGSDCGIANVNIGTSGAEIGGAFGGEKETGGGRESGSDSWKAYMRRQTSTVNYSHSLPLAQGVKFDL